MRRDAYPADWDSVALAVKVAADWVCGDCGRQCRRPGEPFDTHKRTMSVHHIDHNPANCDPSNLAPLCSRCHLALDRAWHTQNAARTRRLKRVAGGQMEIELL